MKERIYFNNLNGLRFLAALMVVVCHIELQKKHLSIPNLREYLRYLGDLGVDLFFVLSGFLITILLLREKEIFKVVNYKNFYLRRVLRIWPLYYLIIILSLFILPNISLFNDRNIEFSSIELYKAILLFVLMLPNVLYLLKSIPFAAQTWSIGTEEQFYLVWPVIINKFKNFKIVFITCILLYWCVYGIINLHFFDEIKYFELFRNWYRLLKFDLLSLGALGAILLYEKNNLVQKINNVYLFLFLVFLLVFLYIYLPNLFEFFRLFYSLIFIILILNLVSNPKIETIFENKMLNYFGQISYGIYMYHNIMIVLVLKIAQNYFKNFTIFENSIVYFFIIALTVLISHLSYKYFEKPILNYKAKFSPFINEKK